MEQLAGVQIASHFQHKFCNKSGQNAIAIRFALHFSFNEYITRNFHIRKSNMSDKICTAQNVIMITSQNCLSFLCAKLASLRRFPY